MVSVGHRLDRWTTHMEVSRGTLAHQTHPQFDHVQELLYTKLRLCPYESTLDEDNSGHGNVQQPLPTCFRE